MYRRSFQFAIAVTFLLVACSPNPVEEILPTETMIPPATVTDAPATPTSTSLPPVETPAPGAWWLQHLEVINAGNWSSLMLLKTYPAEIPLKNAVAAISPDGGTLAVGGISGAQISFFDLAGVEWMRTVTIGISSVGEYFNVTGMEYLPDGTLIVTADGPYAIYHMDMDGNVLSTWEGIGFALSADKKILAHSSTEGLTLVEIASNTPLHTLEDGDALDSSLSPDGSRIATADVGVDYLNTVIWDIEKQTALTTLTGMSNPRFSPDGKFLAVTNWDLDDSNPVQIFSADGTNQIATLRASAPAHLNGTAPLWSADGSLIATQVAKGSPIAWETETWQPLDGPEFQGELDSLSPDGRILITRTDDGAILLWGVLQARG